MTRLFGSSLAIVISLVSVGLARDIHVNNLSGTDISDGSRPQAFAAAAGPVATISKALRLARAGDRVVVANTGEPYRETLSLTGSRHSGSPVGPFVIEGNGAILDGSAPIAPDAWRHYSGDIFYCRPTRLGYQQLFLDGTPALRHPTNAAAYTLPALEPLEWCLADGRIYFRVEQGRMPDDYNPSCCSLQTGVTLYHVRDVVIRDLVVQGFHVDGISAADTARGITLARVACRGNGRGGVSIAGASRIGIDDSLLTTNGAVQFLSDDYGETHLNASQLVPNTAPPIVVQGGRVTISGQSLDDRP